jgi:nucleoside triphosphatase
MPEQAFPEPTVAALIFHNDRFLLVKSPKWKDTWVLAGGHIEVGETMEDALKREIKEETCLDIYDIRFLSVQEFIFGLGFWKKKHFIFFDYCCKTDGDKVVLDGEGSGYRWVTLEEAEKLPIEPYTKKAIEVYKKMLTDTSPSPHSPVSSPHP